MVELGLKAKNAVVTGASRGIGLTIATALAKEEVNIACVATNLDALQKICQQLVQYGVKAKPFAVDVSDYNQVEVCVDEIAKEFGTIDILVNNAGVAKDALIPRISEQDWDKVIAVNLKGYFNFIKCVSKYMIKQRYGRIINISSVIGLYGNPGQANYAASKAGIIALSQTAAKEFGSRSITVNCIAPGFIKSELTEKMPEERKKWVFEHIPLKSFGEPEDIANAVLFLASDMAKYITGHVLVVDGGMTTILI